MTEQPVSGALEFVAETTLPTVRGAYRVRAYRDPTSGTEPLAIVSGDIQGRSRILVRVHDECLTSEVLGSLKCDCREQLEASLDRIREEDGVVIYLRQEGRGIGLANKLRAYHLQDKGLDTVEANEALGLPVDLREYGIGAQILHFLGVRQMRLLTNNPKKIHGLSGYGLELVDQVPLEVPSNPNNVRYLATKREKLGHQLSGEG